MWIIEFCVCAGDKERKGEKDESEELHPAGGEPKSLQGYQRGEV